MFSLDDFELEKSGNGKFASVKRNQPEAAEHSGERGAERECVRVAEKVRE